MEWSEYDDETLEQLLDSTVDTDVSSAGREACCYQFTGEPELLAQNLLSCMSNITDVMTKDCSFQTVSNMNNALLYLSTEELSQNTKFALADSYLRSRHEVLHNLSMLSLGLDCAISDMCFQDLFGIPSVRTPDRIVVRDKLVTIIETTATLNITKSYITKGKLDEGFESKYEKEIRMLRDAGYTVTYHVLSFDMKNTSNRDYIYDLHGISDVLEAHIDEHSMQRLSTIKNVYANTAVEMMRAYSEEVTLILSISVTLQPKIPENLNFLITEGQSSMRSYQRTHISTHMYSKLSNSWLILPYILGRIEPKSSEEKYVLLYDMLAGKFGFQPDRSGVPYNQLMRMLSDNDKPGVIEVLKRHVSGRPIKPDKADVEFFDLKEAAEPVQLHRISLNQMEHANTRTWVSRQAPGDYSRFIQSRFYLEHKHSLEDPAYEENLTSQIMEFYRSVGTAEELDNWSDLLTKKPFAANRLSTKTFWAAKVGFDTEMLSKNSTNDPTFIRHQKSAFVYPVLDKSSVEFCSLSTPPNNALKSISKINLGTYTSSIISEIMSPGFCWGSRPVVHSNAQKEALAALKELNKELYRKQIDIKIRDNLEILPRINKCAELSELSYKLKQQNNVVKRLGAANNKELSMVKIPLKQGRFKEAFKSEMQHYRSKRQKSTHKGIGLMDFKDLEQTFNSLKLFMKAQNAKASDQLYDDFVSEDCSLLKQLKTDHIKNMEDKYAYLRGSNLYGVCEFVSRLCHTLAFLSQASFNGDTVSVDNLGYDSVILLVKGGKKVFRTKKSKLFRLHYPVPPCLESWYNSPGFTSDYIIEKSTGIYYLLTPWQSLDETLMNDGLTFLHRTMSYVLLCHEPEPSVSFDKCFVNVMLAVHARRKTEELLHNLRYVCVNCISDSSRVQDMLPTLAGFNSDCFQAYLRASISENFTKFAGRLLEYNEEPKASKEHFRRCEMRTLIGDTPIDSLEDLTLTIYSTFLMSKSPTNQSLEQVRNLKSMLETHKRHKRESSCTPEGQHNTNGIPYEGPSMGAEWNRLFMSDFNYDSKYCHTVGKFAADYISNVVDKGELSSEWLKICDSGWDDFANTKGLRGEDSENFFNRKGYYVVYDNIMKTPGYLKSVDELFNSTLSDGEKRKKLNSLNMRYKDHLGCTKANKLVFHVVDKKQRGGSREIFVMDLETKICQQAIEKYLQFLCKKVPNEAISIPSNRRLQHIHTTVFEKFRNDGSQTYNISFDCRKWAPHSVINKFIDFIIGMSHILPDSFVTHFLSFFSLMYKKSIYTKKYVHDIMISNESLRELAETNLIKDANIKEGYYFEMSYSWVMGIFNYMSSFMHVMNQLHASHMIYKVTMKMDSEPTFLHMNAHSDDSCGRLQTASDFTMRKAMVVYEFLLKKCNHMLSDKKCNISKKYFEFLSVLYIDNTLLSLLNKITGSFSFHPTDRGYCGDINECYSRSIELLSVGATFEQAYIAQKISAHSIFRFYFNRNPNKLDYMLPTQLLGMPDAHPILSLLTGSDSDMIRLTYKDPGSMKRMKHLLNCVIPLDESEVNLLPPLTVSPYINTPKNLITHKDLLEACHVDDDLEWVIKNSKLKSTAARLIRYKINLQNKTFISSLIDETITRRISRAFYFRSHQVVNTKFGLYSYKEIKECLEYYFLSQTDVHLTGETASLVESVKSEFAEILEGEDDSNLYELLNLEIFEMMRNFNSLSYNSDSIVGFSKTCKPVHINMQKTNLPTEGDFTPSNLTVWICYEKLRWLIPVGDDYRNKKQQLTNFLSREGIELSGLQPRWVYNFLEAFKKRYVKEYFVYTNMPHNIRDISNYRDILNFLSHNSFKNKQILGIVMPYGETVAQRLPALFRDVLTRQEIQVIEVISFIAAVTCSNSGDMDLTDYNINPDVLGLKSKNLIDLLREIILIWQQRGDTAPFIVPHAAAVLNVLEKERIDSCALMNSYYYCFLKSQKLVGNLWLGVGTLYIHTPRVSLVFHLDNQKIVAVEADKQLHTFTQQEISYVNSVLLLAGMSRLENCLENVEAMNWERISLGYSTSGNLTIDKSRNLLLCFKNFTALRHITNPASDLGTTNLKMNPDLTYYFSHGDELLGRKKYTINLYKVDPSDLFNTMNRLLDTPENKSMLSGKNEIPDKFLRMVIGDAAGLTPRINMVNFLEVHRASVTYRVLQKLAGCGILDDKVYRITKHIYPGQDGGMLSCLVEYKKLVSEFGFDHDQVISPELMYIKSSQPDIFIANLLTNINDKYQKLYSGDQKALMKKQLLDIWALLGSEERHARLLTLLTTWGYAGVMGTINQINVKKDKASLLFFRNYGEGNPYRRINLEGLRAILEAIYSAAERINYFSEQIEDKFLVATNLMDLKKVMVSYVHSYMLNTGGKHKPKVLIHQPNIELFKLYKTFVKLTKQEGYYQAFTEELEKDPLTATIPANEETIQGLFVAIETAMNSVSCSFWDEGAKYDNIKQVSWENVRQPYIKTQEVLKDTRLGFRTTKAYHQGVISRELRKHVVRHRVVKLKNKLYDVNIVEGEYSDIRQPFNKQLWLEKPFTEDFYDAEEDVEDIMLELQSTEPDTESFAEIISENYEEDYERRSRVWDEKRHLTNAERYYAMFYTVVDLKSNSRACDYIRAKAHTAVIASNIYLQEIVESGSSCVAVFNNKEAEWYNKSIIDPECLLFYVIDSKPINIPLWEKVLNCKHVSSEELQDAYNNTPCQLLNNENGSILSYDRYLSNNDKMENIKLNIHTAVQEQVEPENNEVVIETEIDRLRWAGFSEGFINKVGKDLDIYKEKFDFSIEDIIRKYVNSKEGAENLKKMVRTEVELVVNKLEDFNKAVRIFEVADVFNVGTRSDSSLRNRALKDQHFRAEIESLAPGLMNKILSGRLTISKGMLVTFKKHLRTMKRECRDVKHNKEAKEFLVDICHLIANDAYYDENNNDDWMFKDIQLKTLNYIVELDEEYGDSDKPLSDNYTGPQVVARLYYE
jgi:hypothetical protein